MATATPAHAVVVCGLNDIDQNVFLVSEGLWSNPVNWSRNHLPVPGEAVCVPGGVTAVVSNASTALLSAQVGQITTLRVEGTIRIQSGTTISLASAIYGGSNLINGGAIRVINGSTFEMNADQNGAPAFQNAVGGSLVQVGAGSRVLVRRPFENAGIVDLTGGGSFVLDSAASAYRGTGSLVGGQARMSSGTVTFQGSGTASVLATSGAVRGTLAAGQSLDVACDTFTNAIDVSQGLVNNGTIRFLPPLAGNCEMDYTLPGGQTLTNNGSITFGTLGNASTSVRFSSNFYNRGGLVANGPTGTIVVNDYWSVLEGVTNDGTITINPGGLMQEPYDPLVNRGTLVNGGGCDLRELSSAGGTVELLAPCNIRTKATFDASSSLRPHWSDSALARLIVGQPTVLAGTVRVTTDGAVPAAGTRRTLVQGPVSGTFAAVTSVSGAVGYTPVYGPSSVELEAGAGTGVDEGGGAVDALVPARLLDTRPGATTADGEGRSAGLQAAGSTVEVRVAGRGGVPADASAAVLNVTVTEAQGPGYVTVYPCGTERPTASSLNFSAGSTVPNGVIAKIGAGGAVCVYVSNGTQVLVDVTGYFTASSPYVALVPARVLDTRPGATTVDGDGLPGQVVAAGGVVEVQVTGRAGVPADASAAVLNVTVTEARGPGYVTVYPCGTERPTASSLNYTAGATVPNNVIAKIGAGGKVCLFASAGTHLIADVNGWFRAGGGFEPAAPARLLDTRPGATTADGAGGGTGVAGAGTVTELQVTGRAGVPGGATAAVLNVTVTDAQGAGYVTVFPCGAARPTASSLNYAAGSTVPNGLIAKVGAGGRVCLFASAGTHLIADLNGWFAG